ncbi:MAG: hypothetical protein ABI190_04645 [Casimicrobiaceae bacterium]
MAIGSAIRHLKKGDWQKAHPIVQSDESADACWAHGIVHMLEGDVGNARYWYRRAHRAFPLAFDAHREIDALAVAVKAHQQEAG